jgi:hypothetical protein
MTEQIIASCIIGLAIGFILGAVSFFQMLKTSINVSAPTRDFWVRLLFDRGSSDEVQRWKRGEFL